MCLKWHKFIKITEILLKLEYTFYWMSKPNWTPSVIWTLKHLWFEQMDGIYKSELHKYLKIKKKYMSYAILT